MRSTLYNSQDYCFLCYNSQLKNLNAFNPLKIIIPFFLMFFLMIFGIFFLVGLNNSFIVGFFAIFFGFSFMIIFFAFAIVNMTMKAQKRKTTYNNVTEPVTGINSFKEMTSKKEVVYDYESTSKKDILRAQQNATISCFECGTYLNLEDKFCPSCGDSTKEELEKYYLKMDK